MSNMFLGITYNFGDIKTKKLEYENGIPYTAWDTSSVTDMSGMFLGTKDFNEDISNWDTSSVKYMSVMFAGATSFNRNIKTKNITEEIPYLSDIPYSLGH